MIITAIRSKVSVYKAKTLVAYVIPIIVKKILFITLYPSILRSLVVESANYRFQISSTLQIRSFYSSKTTSVVILKSNITSSDGSIPRLYSIIAIIAQTIFLTTQLSFPYLLYLIYLLLIDLPSIRLLLLLSSNPRFIVFLLRTLASSISIYIKKRPKRSRRDKYLTQIATSDSFTRQSPIDKVFSTSPFLKFDRI